MRPWTGRRELLVVALRRQLRGSAVMYACPSSIHVLRVAMALRGGDSPKLSLQCGDERAYGKSALLSRQTWN